MNKEKQKITASRSPLLPISTARSQGHYRCFIGYQVESQALLIAAPRSLLPRGDGRTYKS